MFGKKDKVWTGLEYQVVNHFDEDIKTVKFVNKSNNKDPEYANAGDSGFDLRAWVTESDENAKVDKDSGKYFIVLKSFETRLIHTGLYVELPEYTEGQVRTRSGMALKQQLVVTNSPGTIDRFYTGEIGIIMTNLSKKAKTIMNGDRIAQFVVCPVHPKELIDFKKVEEINTNKERGQNGFGSSGIK